MENKFPDINLPVWMNKGEPLTLAHASKTWWGRVRDWLTFPLAQIDVDTCDEQLLALLAYQRDVERFPGESLSLFRLRVKYAFVNAQDAGCMVGFSRIFERLEIGEIQQLERQLQYDWDVILIRINDEQLSRDNTLMMRLVRQYGRTCRRYFFDVMNESTDYIHPGHFDCVTWFDHYKLRIRPSAIVPELDEVWLLPGDERAIGVRVIPDGVDDASFSAATADAESCTASTGDGIVTLRATGIGETQITLKTTDAGRAAVIIVHVVAGARADIHYTKGGGALFYISGSEDYLVDYGDGHPGREYVSITGGGVASTVELELDATHTITVYGSESVTFSKSGVLGDRNQVTKLHALAGHRASISYLLYGHSGLAEIAPGAFDYLDGLTSASYAFEGCTKLKALPAGFLCGETGILSIEGAFRQSGLTALPAGFLSGASKLQDIYRAFAYCPLTTVEPGMLLACSEALINISTAFFQCSSLTSDVNDIFSAETYPHVINSASLFYGAAKVTGEATKLIDKLPAVTTHTQMFTGCTQLSDYKDIPAGWRMMAASGDTGE